MDEDLRERLHTAAASHRPDRERMLARIERGMAEETPVRVPRAPRTPRPWLRVAGATAAVCGVLAAGAFAATSAGPGEPEGVRGVAARPPPPHRSRSGAGHCPPRTAPCGPTVRWTPTATGSGRRAM